MRLHQITAAVIALACLMLVAAGCGSGEKTNPEIKVSTTPSGPVPRPKETLADVTKSVEAVQAKIRAGNCAAVKAFAKERGDFFLCTPKARKAYRGFKVTRSEAFGTGALLEFTDAEIKAAPKTPTPRGVTPPVKRNTGLLILALDPTGRYAFAASISPIMAGPTIGTKPVDWKGADSNAVVFLKAVRDKDCKPFFKYSLTPKGMPEKQACAQGLGKFYAPLEKALKSAKDVKLFRFGGTDQFYFYGLRTGRDFRTLVTAANPPPGPPFLALGTLRATK